jgi:hypothetical protein
MPIFITSPPIPNDVLHHSAEFVEAAVGPIMYVMMRVIRRLAAGVTNRLALRHHRMVAVICSNLDLSREFLKSAGSENPVRSNQSRGYAAAECAERLLALDCD